MPASKDDDLGRTPPAEEPGSGKDSDGAPRRGRLVAATGPPERAAGTTLEQVTDPDMAPRCGSAYSTQALFDHSSQVALSLGATW